MDTNQPETSMNTMRRIFPQRAQVCALAGLILLGSYAQADTFDEKRTAMSSTVATQPTRTAANNSCNDLRTGERAGSPSDA